MDHFSSYLDDCLSPSLSLSLSVYLFLCLYLFPKTKFVKSVCSGLALCSLVGSQCGRINLCLYIISWDTVEYSPS